MTDDLTVKTILFVFIIAVSVFGLGWFLAQIGKKLNRA